MNKNDEKLQNLANQWGYDDSDDFVSEQMFASIVPGICMNDDCEYTTDIEPDQSRGFCELCGTKTVKSGLLLAGVI